MSGQLELWADARLPRTLNTSVHFSSASNEWATDDEVFNALDREFGFTLDVASTVENAKCKQFFTQKENGLLQDWRGHVCWMNPPYGREIGKWIEKAYNEAQRGAIVVCLIPARTDTDYWHRWCFKGEVRFIKGRLKFGNHKNNAPFPSAIVIFRHITEKAKQLLSAL
ncbi:MAG: adenine methyltransferase [Desulfurellales bacterium]|nr:MAG: adenine methyltransferase [Desulfurellales bacterium]